MLGFSFTVQILFPLPLPKVFIAHSTLVRTCLPRSGGQYGALPVSFHLVKAVEVPWGVVWWGRVQGIPPVCQKEL